MHASKVGLSPSALAIHRDLHCDVFYASKDTERTMTVVTSGRQAARPGTRTRRERMAPQLLYLLMSVRHPRARRRLRHFPLFARPGSLPPGAHVLPPPWVS